jgi:hypothetical protein
MWMLYNPHGSFYFDSIQYLWYIQRELISSWSVIVPQMSKFLWIITDIQDSSNYKWPCFSVLEHKMTCTQRVKWQSLGTTKWEIYVNKEKYFVKTFLVELCIILHCRIDDVQDDSILRRGIPAAHTIYGFPSTVSAANYVNFIGLNRIQSLNHSRAMALCTGL